MAEAVNSISQELVFKHFNIAAKLGHGFAMQSLGICFDDGVGCRANRRMEHVCRCLHNSAQVLLTWCLLCCW